MLRRRPCSPNVSKNLFMDWSGLFAITDLFSTPGDVFGAEISRFGRTPVHVRLPSQTTAVAANFVECWAVPKSSLKGIADGLILYEMFPQYQSQADALH